jgi:malonate transporter
MIGVLIGFAVIAFVIAVGYLVGRLGILGPTAATVLNRTALFVLSPALMFTVLAEADPVTLLTDGLPVAAAAAAGALFTFFVIARVVWRRAVPEATVGALASGYSNAGNIGIPVSAYVLGDISASAPVILLQLVVLAPLAVTILDLSVAGRPSIARILSQPIRNPLVVGAGLGFVVSVTGWEVPAPVLAPFELIGAAAVPVMLLSFGIALHGSRPFGPDTDTRGVVLASTLKLVLMPVLAWLVARFLFGLDGAQLFAVVALAALPTAQNVFTHAFRYDRATALARDTILVTTVLSVPALLIVAALLAPR